MSEETVFRKKQMINSTFSIAEPGILTTLEKTDKYGPIHEVEAELKVDVLSFVVAHYRSVSRDVVIVGDDEHPFKLYDHQVKNNISHDIADKLHSLHHSAVKDNSEPWTDDEIDYRKAICEEIEITDQDREIADDIRTYYLSDLMYRKMHDCQIGKWGTELGAFLSREDHYTLKRREIPILSTLIKAYQIDQEVDRCLLRWGEPSDAANKGFRFLHQNSLRVVGSFASMKQPSGVSVVSLMCLTENDQLVEYRFAHSSTLRFFLDYVRCKKNNSFLARSGSVKYRHKVALDRCWVLDRSQVVIFNEE